MLRRILLSLLGGLALWLAFPDTDIWFLAPVGIALLVAATRGVGPVAGFLLGVAGGLAWFVPYVSWTGLHVGPLPWLALATLQALFVGLFGLAIALAHRRDDRRNPLVVAAIWSAAEWARGSVPFGGFPWGRIGFSQADSPLLHLASLGGVALLGFAVALVGALLLLVVDALLAHRSAWVVGGLVLLTSLVIVAPQLVPVPTDGPQADVMSIQGNTRQAGLDFNQTRREILDNHARVTHEAAGRVRAGEFAEPDLVVWPENASDIDPFVNADAGRVIDASVDDIGRPVLVGAVLGGGRSDLTNTAIVWEPGVGATDQRYDKRALVPFAEYMPYRAFFRAITSQVDLLERDFVPGEAVGVLDVPTRDGSRTIRAGLGICFEVAVDHVLLDTLHEGANLLVIQTNNAMFDFSAEAAQQLGISRVRAVEYGRSVVHSSNVGISALITPDGVAHQPTELFTADILSGELPLRSDLTLATRIGPWTDRVLAIAALLGVLFAWRPRRVAATRR